MFFTSLPMHLKLRHDVAMTTSRRTKDCVAMQQALRRDAFLKVKGRLEVKK